MNRRQVATGLGVSLAVFALASLLAPRFAASIPVGRPVVVFLGVVVLGWAGRRALERRTVSLAAAETDDPEVAMRLPTPGDDFDDRLEESLVRGRNRSNRQRIRDRLERAAVETVMRHRGCSREAARRAVERGTWTDDPFAAAFFTHGAVDLSLRKRLRAFVDAEPTFNRRARHAATAIYELSREVAT